MKKDYWKYRYNKDMQFYDEDEVFYENLSDRKEKIDSELLGMISITNCFRGNG